MNDLTQLELDVEKIQDEGGTLLSAGFEKGLPKQVRGGVHLSSTQATYILKVTAHLRRAMLSGKAGRT